MTNRFVNFILILGAYRLKLGSPPTIMLGGFFVAELLKEAIFYLTMHIGCVLMLDQFLGLHHQNGLSVITLQSADRFFVT